MTFRTHAVLVVPGYGHSDASGAYDMGYSAGRYTQMDVVDGYMETLVEELDIDGIRVEVMPTRKRPGVRDLDRHRHVEPNQMVIHLSCGYYTGKTPPQKNMSAVFYGPAEAKDLAKEVSEAMSTWGQCYVWGHRNARPEPSPEKIINVEKTMGLRIEPILLNGPDLEEYMQRLPALGTCLGRAISSYLMVRNHARARIAASMDNRKAQ